MINSPLSISIIVPIFNEVDVIDIFYRRLCQVISEKDLADSIVEILFIDNCSSDGSYEKIFELAERDSRISIIRHSRNFGYQASIVCGLSNAAGRELIFIDVDCEDPPEMIPLLIEEYLTNNYDLVYGERSDRDENLAIKVVRKIFYRLSKMIADSEFILDMAEFALITDRMRNEILKNKSTFPFVRSDFAYVGFRSKGIKYKRQKRVAGETHYNLTRMFRFALAGMLTISTFPLRLISYLGFFLLLLWFTYFLYAIVLRSSEYLINLLFGISATYLIFCNMFTSLYLSRIYKDGVQRPLFVIDYELSRFKLRNENP